MKKINFLILLAGLAGLAACTQKNAPETPAVVEEPNFSLIASADDFTSRTELCACKEINWKSGDELSVWEKDNSGNANKQFTVTAASAGTSTGQFTGNLTPASSTFTLYSVYPYSSTYGSDPTSVALTIPAEINQTTDINDIIGVSDFMVGRTDNTLYDSESGAYTMQFHHPLAFVQFHIDGRGCVYEEAIIKSLTMTADVAFVGDVILNCETGNITSAESGDGGKTLVINFPSTAAMSDAQDAWAAINPVDLTDANCKFILEMTNGQKVTFTVNPKNLASQSLYKFEFSEIDAKITAGKGVPTYVDLVGLSGGERSNCYIVTEGGYYRFTAQRVDKTNVFSGIKPYTDGYRADWLWQSTTEPKVSEVGIGNSGNINFKVEPASECNATIALKDPDGKIVWSWHIWCTTSDPLTPHSYSRNNSWCLASRNVGSLSDTDAGLYYQWGRKDPFPADRYAVTRNAGVAFGNIANTIQEVENGTIAYSIANPTRFITGNKDGYCWVSNADEVAAIQNLWFTGTAHGSKTNYDPCPPGYQVPTLDGYIWATAGGDAAWKLTNMTFYTGYFTYTHGDVTTTYPAGGYLSGLTLTDGGVTARCWAANLSVAPKFSYSMLVNVSTQTLKREGSRTSFGLNVRCMKI